MFFDECNGDGVVWLRVEVEIDNGCFCFCIFGIFFRGILVFVMMFFMIVIRDREYFIMRIFICIIILYKILWFRMKVFLWKEILDDY